MTNSGSITLSRDLPTIFVAAGCGLWPSSFDEPQNPLTGMQGSERCE